jgi:hypothetical protein
MCRGCPLCAIVLNIHYITRIEHTIYHASNYEVNRGTAGALGCPPFPYVIRTKLCLNLGHPWIAHPSNKLLVPSAYRNVFTSITFAS